jgi:hypothetical protein
VTTVHPPSADDVVLNSMGVLAAEGPTAAR